MDKEDLATKYQKLAIEYSKIRSCTSVLKKAVLEEQKKTANLREIIRTKEQVQRRIEQELDSVTFCNKQMTKRCEKMMQELQEQEIRKSVKNAKSKQFTESKVEVIAEELQKTIIENARLASLVSDKNSEIDCYVSRVADLEQKLAKNMAENTENERKLRREIELLNIKYAEIKIGETSNSICSEDAISVSGASDTPANPTSEDSTVMLSLETQVKQEIHKMFLNCNVNDMCVDARPLSRSTKINRDGKAPEEIIFERIRRRIEGLIEQKKISESKFVDYSLECEALKNHLEIMDTDVQEKEQQTFELRSLLQQTEGDLITTRINYEDKISVLTEQIINLSDQLVASP